MDYEARIGLSREKIRILSVFVRKILQVRTLKFPVLKVLDKLEILFPDNFYYVSEEDSLFEKNVPAYIEQEGENEYCIHIKQSVYDGALKGRGDCLGFINHEIAHFCLIHIFDIGPKNIKFGNSIIYSREPKEGKIPPFKSMEWQAKALCGELMIPYEKCKDMSYWEIISKTKSSMEQAAYFVDTVVPSSR